MRAFFGILALVVTAVLLPRSARGNERHFTFTHESATLPSGTFELEPWLTFHGGRRNSFVGFDYRLEFEGGLTDRLLGAFYLNGDFHSVTGGSSTVAGTLSTASVELKYRLLDSVADPIGLAIYTEFTAGPALVEIEAKVIADRRFGNFLVAANLIGEYDWVMQPGDSPLQMLELEATLAAGYFITNEFMVGLEFWSYNRITTTPEVLFPDSVLYAGPVVSYGWRRFWVAASVMPQIAAFRGSSYGDVRNIDTQDMVYARFLVGFHW